MNPQYDGWLKSGHRHTATCVECHLPHEGIAKWAAKAEHGFRHSAAFTLQNFKEPIEITPRDREMVRVNCVRCHEGLVQAIAECPGGPTAGSIVCTATPAPGTAPAAEKERSWRASVHPRVRLRGWLLAVLILVGIAGVTVLLLALLTNIFERKQEARQTFVRLVEVTEDTTDPKVWGQNWPQQYDSYLRTSLPTTTKYGGRGLGASDTGPAEQKLDRDPWLKRIFAGYAFALDYRDRRGHFYALFDQEQTRRVTEKQQPGACLQCHASNLPLYRFVGKGDVQKGFEQVSAMPYREARET